MPRKIPQPAVVAAAGTKPKRIEEYFGRVNSGHAHVSVTLGLYSHVLPSHDRDAADALGRALDQRLAGRGPRL